MYEKSAYRTCSTKNKRARPRLLIFMWQGDGENSFVTFFAPIFFLLLLFFLLHLSKTYGLFVRGRTVQYYSSEAFFRGKGMKIADVLLVCFPRQISCKNREALLNEEVKRRRRVR